MPQHREGNTGDTTENDNEGDPDTKGRQVVVVEVVGEQTESEVIDQAEEQPSADGVV